MNRGRDGDVENRVKAATERSLGEGSMEKALAQFRNQKQILGKKSTEERNNLNREQMNGINFVIIY